MSEQILRTTSARRCQVIPLGRIDEPRGSLCVAEVGRHIPFAVYRTYWIFDVPDDATRAGHAHREQSEVLVALRGSVVVECDEGDSRALYTLDSPDEALLLPPLVFHEVYDFAPGSLCLVLASGPYERDEYINDYGEFRELIARR